jgi:hypothetical protein
VTEIDSSSSQLADTWIDLHIPGVAAEIKAATGLTQAQRRTKDCFSNVVVIGKMQTISIPLCICESFPQGLSRADSRFAILGL